MSLMIFSGIGCFKGIFTLQIKEGSMPYQELLLCNVYVLQQPFKQEME